MKERYDHARSDVAGTHPRPPMTGAKERREKRVRRKRVEMVETPKQGLAMQRHKIFNAPPLHGEQAEVRVGSKKRRKASYPGPRNTKERRKGREKEGRKAR